MLVLPEVWLRRWKGRDIFEQIFALQGDVYKRKDRRKTFCFAFNGSHYFAKLHYGVGWKEIIKNLAQLRMPVLSARNEWQAVKHLDALGVNTTPLVGYGKRGWNPARIQSFVITEALADTESLEDFCRDWAASPPDPALKKALIEEVARIARLIHEHGMNHRDLYICHFLIDIAGGRKKIDPRDIKLYLIDLHRMQKRRHLPRRWRIKDLAALYFSSMDTGLTQRDLLRFVRAYEGRPLRESLKDRRLFWRRVKRRADRLYRGFNK